MPWSSDEIEKFIPQIGKMEEQLLKQSAVLAPISYPAIKTQSFLKHKDLLILLLLFCLSVF